MTTEAGSVIDIPGLIAQLKQDRARFYRGKFELLDQQLGQSRGYFGRGLAGLRPLRLKEVLGAIRLFGFEPHEYLARLTGDLPIFGEMPDGFLSTRRRTDRSRPIHPYRALLRWSDKVVVHEAGDALRFEPHVHAELFGDTAPEHVERFGQTLLEIIATKKPARLQPRAMQELVATLIIMARQALEQEQSATALDFLEIAFRLETKAPDFAARADAFRFAGEALRELGFLKDAGWCFYESAILTLGKGEWKEVQARLSDYRGCAERFENEASMMHLLHCAAEERKASGVVMSKELIDKPLGKPRYAFLQHVKGLLWSTLTLDRWNGFASGMVTPLTLERVFRRPYSVAAGSDFLRQATTPPISGKRVTEIHERWIAWVGALEVIDDGASNPPVVFPTTEEAVDLLSGDLPSALRNDQAFAYLMALAVMGKRCRQAGEYRQSLALYTAALDFESKIDSRTLRCQLSHMSAFLLVSVGNFVEAHLLACRALHLSLGLEDPMHAAKALHALATMEMLRGNFREAIWLFSGSLDLAPLGEAFVASVHYSIGFCWLKLKDINRAQDALWKAEGFDVPVLYPNLCYLNGAIRSYQGQEAEANRWFTRAASEFEAHGFTVDRILFALYHVAHLLRFGKLMEAITEARKIEQMAVHLGDNPVVQAVVLELRQKTRQGLLTLSLVEAMHQALECPWTQTITRQELPPETRW